MSNVIHKQVVLKLNRNWQVIGFTSVSQAITALCGGEHGVHPALAMDLAPSKNEDGSYNFEEMEYITPTKWEDWIKLPINDWDMQIDTARGPIRMPTVIISTSYAEVPMKAPKLSKRAILERDNLTCQYTGEKLSVDELNVDHVIPRDQGGKDTWDNLVASKISVNSMKGNRFNEEVGLKLLKKPKAPPSIPASASITEAKHPSWNQFLIKKKS